MFRVQVLTLFPELFETFKGVGLFGRAVDEGRVELTPIHLRQFAINTHGQIDDSPYGGGSGMVLRPDAAFAALEHAKAAHPKARTVLLTPRGKPLTQVKAHELAQRAVEGEGLILLCTRYEGIDERIVEECIDEEICLGDFIVMGGECAAMALLEAVTRLLPGVLGNPSSIVHESFEGGLLEGPQYTKPQAFHEREVPPVLLSGNHREIEKWRAEQAYADTVQRRPDLIRGPITPKGELSVGLVHHPVLDKQGTVITSSITNIDLHDIARSSRTFGVNHFYVSHPVKAMRRLAENLCEHWASGFGYRYNPNRSDALSTISLVADIDDMLLDIETRTGKLPKVIITSARPGPEMVSYGELRQELLQSDAPHLILFGTGWGMTDEVCARADIRLEPIYGPTPYNHLSVRGAAAIILSRLLG